MYCRKFVLASTCKTTPPTSGCTTTHPWCGSVAQAVPRPSGSQPLRLRAGYRRGLVASSTLSSPFRGHSTPCWSQCHTRLPPSPRSRICLLRTPPQGQRLSLSSGRAWVPSIITHRTWWLVTPGARAPRGNQPLRSSVSSRQALALDLRWQCVFRLWRTSFARPRAARWRQLSSTRSPHYPPLCQR